MSEFTKLKNHSSILLSNFPVLSLVLSQAAVILDAAPSPLCRAYLGLPSPQLINRTLTEFIYVDDVDTFIKEAKQAIANEEAKTLAMLSCYLRFRASADRFVLMNLRGQCMSSQPKELSLKTGTKFFFITLSPENPSAVESSGLFDELLELLSEEEYLHARKTELEAEILQTEEGLKELVSPTFPTASERNIGDKLSTQEEPAIKSKPLIKGQPEGMEYIFKAQTSPYGIW